MTPEELYRQAIGKHTGKNEPKENGYFLHSCGLKKRIVALLARANSGYIDGYAYDKSTPNVDKIRQDVLSGKILEVRNLGTGTLKEICEWLVENDTTLSTDD